MPAAMSVVEAIEIKQTSKFLYPAFVADIYCLIGCLFDLWHPYWFLFITIPVFYVITNLLDIHVFKTKEDDKDKEDE